MEVAQIAGVALISVFIILLLKQYKPEFVIHISILAGILIFLMILPKLSSVIELLNNLVRDNIIDGVEVYYSAFTTEHRE